MKILITWWSWFIGRNLINKLLSKWDDIEIYNLSPSQVGNTIHIPIVKNELFDFSTLWDNFDYIIHTLALSSETYCTDFDLTDKINVWLTKEILKFATKQKKLKKFLHFSSIMLYDNENVSPVKETDRLNTFYWNYSFTKWVAEEYVKYFWKKQDIPFVILRISNIYWPWQTYINSPFLIPEKIYEALTSWIINLQNPNPIRDFLYIDDATDAMEKILFSSSVWEYNLWSWIWISIWDLVEEIAKELNVKIINNNLTTRWPTKFYCDISKIKNTIDWEPKIILEEWIKRTINFIQNNY